MTGVERAMRYCSDVESGKQVTNNYIKLAVKRFRTDLSRSGSEDFPYYLDESSANRFIQFTEMLKQYKDRFSGKALILEDWQCFVFVNIYGWLHIETKERRFRKAFVFVARKNGKTTMMASTLLWDLLSVPGAESYCAANKKDQSKIIFEAVEQMVRQNSMLSSRLKVFKSTSRIINSSSAGRIEALSSDSDRFDGLNPSCVVVDELSAMKNFNVIRILQSGQGSRPSPLLFEITSGSDDLTSAGKQEFDRSVKLLEGVIEDESYFCVLYCIDKTDDWKDERNWIKANPNINISVNLDFLRKSSLEAQQQPALESEFRTKNLGEFLSNSNAWISNKAWAVCEANSLIYRLDFNRPYFAVGAIDLSKRQDLTAFTVIAYQDGKYFLEHRLYFPEASLEKRIRRENELWRKWVEGGYVRTTPGEVINYSFMNRDIDELAVIYRLEEILFDPYNSTSLINDLGDSYNLVEVPQSIKMLSPYAKAFEEEVLAGNVVDGNPVAKWAVSNTQVYVDANNNIKPIKIDERKESRHIDSVITSMMGIGRIKALLDQGEVDLRTADQVKADTESFISNLNLFG